MGLMSDGMAVAMYTTLSGLIGSILLQTQYYMLDGATAKLFGLATDLTEVFVVSVLEQGESCFAPFCRDRGRASTDDGRAAQDKSAVAERRDAKVEGWTASAIIRATSFDPFQRHAVQGLAGRCVPVLHCVAGDESGGQVRQDRYQGRVHHHLELARQPS